MWTRRVLLPSLLMALVLVLGLLVASGSAQAQTSLNLQASGQDIDGSMVAPNTSVTTQSVAATDSLTGSPSWVFSMGSPSQSAVTDPEISVDSGYVASNFSSGGACSGVTAATASMPFTWTEPALPGSNCPGPYQLSANLSLLSPVTFSPGFTSSRTVDTSSIASGGTQTMTVGVTAQSPYTSASQLSVQWMSGGQTGMASASVTDATTTAAVSACAQPDPGTVACLSSEPTMFPNPGSQWTLIHPVVGDTYDFQAVLNNTSGMAITSLPSVTVTGTPNGAPHDIVNQTSPDSTSATLQDSSLDGTSPGTGSVTFSTENAANWTLNLQHQFVVDYQGYPSQGGGGGGGGQMNVMPNMGLSSPQTVSVSAMGLQADTNYQLQECSAGAGGCDPSNSVPVTTDGSGNFGPASFTVHQNITVNGNPIDCSVVGCSIEATGPQQPPPTAPISFGGGGGGGGGQMNVMPNGGLSNPATVSVSAMGLQANTSYQLQECGGGGCDPSNSVPVTTDGSGNFGPVTFTAHQDITVNGNPIDCTVAGCSIEATGPQQPPPTSPITFAGGGGGSGPSLHATPSFNLNDQSIVSVSGTGLQANAGYQLEECTTAGCDPSHSVPVSTDGTGNFGPTSFTAFESIEVNGTPIDCTVASCSIEATGQGAPAPSAAISFFVGTLHPSTTGGLLDGQPISVTSDRLEAGTTGTYALTECTAVACDPSTLVQTTTDFLGHISTLYTVHQHLSYADPVSGLPDHVDCYSTQCFLRAFDSLGGAATGPADIWFAGSPLQDASLFGTVTLPGGKALPAGTQSGVVACQGGPNCDPAAAITADVTASASYGITSLTPGQLWDVAAYAVVQTLSGPQLVYSAHYQVTPTAGQVVTNNFVIEGFTPLPAGDFVTGTVTDLDGNPLPANPYGGPDFSPQSGVLACPGSEVFGDPDCTDITNLLAPTDASGNYNFWLPAGTWNLAPFTTFAGIPGAPAITGAYQQVTIQPNIDPVVNLVIPLALTLTYTGPTVVTNGATATLSGKIVDQNGNPVGDQLVTLSLGAQSCTGWTDQTTGVASCSILVSQTVGPISASETLTQDPQYEPSRLVPGYVQTVQTITFGPLPNKTYGNFPFSVSATASSGLAVTFSVTPSSPGVCAAGGTNGRVITIIGGGVCTVQAQQAGNVTYAPALPVRQSFTVARGNQVILLLPIANRTMLQSPVTPLALATSGLPVTFSTTTPSVCTSGSTRGQTITLVGAGRCTVTASQAGNGNYNAAPTATWTFMVSKAAQSISFAPISNRSLTHSPFTVTATATSGMPVTFTTNSALVCTVSGTTVTLEQRGTCTIVAHQAGNGTWNPASDVARSFRVT